MKYFVTVLAFASLVNAHAAKRVEFDEAQELKCHQEVKTLGCVNAAGEEVDACREKKKAKLSPTCKKMHEEKKQNG